MKAWPICFTALVIACAVTAAHAVERRYTYHEFDGVYVFFETKRLEVYRRLLPDVFQMPDEPLVQAFVADYYKMDARTQPYREAAVFLLAQYQEKNVWHCITMPVTSDEARRLGIRFLGFPKIMGDVRLQRDPPKYTGTLKLGGTLRMSVQIATKGHVITDDEKRLFDDLASIPMVNLRRGKPVELGAGRRRRTRLLQKAKLFPKRLELKVGRATVKFPKVATAGGKETAFDLHPSRIRLGYYFKNTFPFSLGGRMPQDRE